ncbi:MarR family winged helix-turn-helix transcriptional regulator [Tigheibacillus jepli]|uniref:MarR family winged helix-turn-helix transcriptional regulator n=1 Tax=Tigheibacillus jepli TaxID=3035914 RepID=UPI00387E04B0
MSNNAADQRNVDLSLKLFVVLTRALQSIEKQVVRDIRKHHLNLTEFAVLELLFHKGSQPIQKIGQKVLLASSSITYVVDKLEQKKWLVRKASPDDRRVTLAQLTPDGNRLMEAIFPEHSQAINEIMDVLTADEKQNLIEQLKKLGYHAENM